MSTSLTQQQRETQAKNELNHTKLSSRIAYLLTAQFLLVIFAVPIIQIIFDSQQSQGESKVLNNLFESPDNLQLQTTQSEDMLFSQLLQKNRVLLNNLDQLENGLKETSQVAQFIRPPSQHLLTSWLGVGNEQVYPGRSSWLFYHEDLDYLMERKALDRALQPILHFNTQLTTLGIRLIVMPTPVKPTIHPEKFSRYFEYSSAPLQALKYETLIGELEQNGVLVFDPAELLAQAKQETGHPQYLMTDTHWRPNAVQVVAEHLHDFIKNRHLLPILPKEKFTSHTIEATNTGDTTRLLDLPDKQILYPKERVLLRQIRTRNDASWQHDTSADILVLGDSFSNIYSLATMGWGESSGFVEQLSFVLQRPVDRIVQNNDGAFATRELLARELATGHDRLSSKRLIIFQFSSRELANGNWKFIDLNLSDVWSTNFFVPKPATTLVVRGTVQEVTSVPQPGTVPYPDHIMAVHLTNVTVDKENLVDQQVLVYMWGMRNHDWEPAAYLDSGDTITVLLKAWADVASDYDGINRTELESDYARYEPPAWGEIIKE